MATNIMTIDQVSPLSFFFSTSADFPTNN